jgi:hypothetical protein
MKMKKKAYRSPESDEYVIEFKGILCQSLEDPNQKPDLAPEFDDFDIEWEPTEII